MSRGRLCVTWRLNLEETRVLLQALSTAEALWLHCDDEGRMRYPVKFTGEMQSPPARARAAAVASTLRDHLLDISVVTKGASVDTERAGGSSEPGGER